MAGLSTCGVAVDHAGSPLIADSSDYRIRVVAASTGIFYGRAMTAGDIYTVAWNGTGGSPGTVARPPRPSWNCQGGSRGRRSGNLVIADTLNNRVRLVADRTGTFYGQAMTAGDIYTVAGGGTGGLGDGGPATAAKVNGPGGVVVDGAGNLLITDTGSNRVRQVTG